MIKKHAKNRRFNSAVFVYVYSSLSLEKLFLQTYACSILFEQFCFSYALYFSKTLFGHFFCSFFIGTLQHFVQKLFETVAFRVGKKLIRRCLFENFAFCHKENPSADFSCKSHLVRDDNHRHSLVCNLFD